MENKGDSKKLTQDFKKIKGLLSKYVKDSKIKPNELYRFLKTKKNLNNFIEKESLDDDSHTRRVIKDVIDNMLNKEKDIKESTVIKFGKFTEKLNESVLDTQSYDTYNYEKVLADYYNTSVKHVEVIDDKKHLFSIKDFDSLIKVVCLSSEEFETIKRNILTKIKEEIFMSNVTISTIDNTSIPDLTFNISSVFQENIDLTGLINDTQFFRIIISILKNSIGTNIWRSKPEIFQGFYIWEIPSES